MLIFKRELRAHRKSLILWSAAILLVIVSALGKYSTAVASGQSINALFDQIPEAIKAVLGMGNFDLSTISGFYGMCYLYLALLAAVHAVLLGANIIAKEERDKTTEFLLVKPVSRQQILTSKLSAAMVNIAVFNLITLIFSVILVAQFSKGENITGEILLLMLGMFALQLIFLSLGTGIAAAAKRPKASASTASAILLAAFILSSVFKMNSSLGFLKYFTPFQYFDAESILDSGGFQAVFVLLSLAMIAVLVTLTYVSYQKRDMRI